MCVCGDTPHWQYRIISSPPRQACRLLALSADLVVATSQFLHLAELTRLACCHSTLRALCTLRSVDAVNTDEAAAGAALLSPAVARRQAIVITLDNCTLQWEYRLYRHLSLLERIVCEVRGRRVRHLLLRPPRDEQTRPLRHLELESFWDRGDGLSNWATIRDIATAHPRLETLRLSSDPAMRIHACPTESAVVLPPLARLREFTSPFWEWTSGDCKRVFAACPRLAHVSFTYHPTRLADAATASECEQIRLSAAVFAAAPATLTDLTIRDRSGAGWHLFDWLWLQPIAAQLEHLRLEGFFPTPALPIAASEPLIFARLRSLRLGTHDSFDTALVALARFPQLTTLHAAGIVPQADRLEQLARSVPRLQQLHLHWRAYLCHLASRIRLCPALLPELRLVRVGAVADRVDAVKGSDALRAVRPACVIELPPVEEWY